MRLDAVTVERLRSMCVAHDEDRLRFEVGRSSGGDVLAEKEDGSPLRPEHLTTEWRRLCERASAVEVEAGRDPVPYLGLHAARHGAVKLLRAAGISDGVIARRMGHDENVMRVVYVAPHTVEQDPAAAVMDRLVG